MTEATADDVKSVLALLTGIPVWVGGGWAVDALHGAQTRAHSDVDLAFDASYEPEVVERLESEGYRLTVDWRPGRFVMSLGRVEIDLHPVAFDSAGEGLQSTHDGLTYRYPSDGFTSGTIDGVDVPCLTPERLRAFRKGYELRDVDLHDLRILDDL